MTDQYFDAWRALGSAAKETELQHPAAGMASWIKLLVIGDPASSELCLALMGASLNTRTPNQRTTGWAFVQYLTQRDEVFCLL